MSINTAGFGSRVMHGVRDWCSGERMVWPAVLSVAADRAVTLPFFGFESNPTVTAVGPLLWIAITVLALGGLITLWFSGELWRYRLPRWLMASILLGHVAVVLGNLAVIAGGL